VHGEEAGRRRRTQDAVRTADDPTDATAARALGAGGDARRVLDRYRLARRIGSGGFGVVWLAEDERLERAVAVKRIAMHDDAVAVRAEREARAAARLSHPGIVALYESGRDDEAFYLVSELVRGRTLAELMRDGELSDRDVLRVGVALCDALAHAHGRGVIHRDVKPGNVIVPDQPHDGAGVAKLTDFGVARMIGDDALTITGDVVGTLAYMAPEQAAGGEVGEEADLYALALVLYEALSGVNRCAGAAPRPRPGGSARACPRWGACAATFLSSCAAPGPRGPRAPRAARHAGRPAGRARRWPAGGRRRARDDRRQPARGPGRSGAARAHPPARPRPRGPRRGRPDRRRAGLADARPAPSRSRRRWAPRPPRSPCSSRRGWAGSRWSCALAAWAGGATALVIAMAALPTVVLLRRAGTLWSVPAGAPLLGMAGLAGAWPALAAQAARPWERAALGALGGWWLALAEVLTGDRLALGAPPDAALDAKHLDPLLTSGALALVGLWALGRRWSSRSSCAGACSRQTWSAPPRGRPPFGSATQAVAGTLSWQPTMRGLVAGAVVAGGLAVAFAASRGRGVRAFRLVASPQFRRVFGLGCPRRRALPRPHEPPAQPRGQARRPRRGTFGRVFRTQVRPVEIARKLAREMDEHKTVSVSRTYVPNEYVVWLGPRTAERFEGVEHEVTDELVGLPARARPPRELALVSRPQITSTPTSACAWASSASRRGSCAPPREAVEQADHGTRWSTRPRPRAGGAARRAHRPPRPRDARGRGQALRRRPGRRRIGRSRECDIVLADSNVSRRHAELRPLGDGWTITDWARQRACGRQRASTARQPSRTA
jgi:hypothetical protein